MNLKRIILFGDSLIESAVSCENGGFFHPMAEEFCGRADIIVRAYPSFTTPEIAPFTDSVCAQHPNVVLLGFGNSDSALPGQIQHVEIDVFREKLEGIASAVAEHGAWPIMVTPVAPNEDRIRSRELKVTRDYALVCRDVAESMQAEVVDLFHGMQLCDDWTKELLLNDGLSLNRNGHTLLYKLIRTAVDKMLPPDSMHRQTPSTVPRGSE